MKKRIKELGAGKGKRELNVPNSETVAAMQELKAGRGKRFKSVEELFKSI